MLMWYNNYGWVNCMKRKERKLKAKEKKRIRKEKKKIKRYRKIQRRIALRRILKVLKMLNLFK